MHWSIPPVKHSQSDESIPDDTAKKSAACGYNGLWRTAVTQKVGVLTKAVGLPWRMHNDDPGEFGSLPRTPEQQCL